MNLTTIRHSKPEGFKDTEIGKIPEDWEVKVITDLFNIETGTTPSTKQTNYWENGTLNWFTPADMSKLDGQIEIDESERKITEKALKETNLTLMPEGSILMSTRAPVGYISILKKKAAFNQGCKGLIPKDEKIVLSIFYAYYLISKRQFLNSLSGGSTFKELSKNSLERLLLPLPPILEQRAIASILGTVDSAIQKVNEAIAGTERLKRGLMQRLLTKGIGHRKFKDSEIGKIPEEWGVVRLGDVAELKNGVNFDKTQKGNKGILTIDVLNMYGNGIYSNFDKLYRVNIALNSDYLLKKGDILFVRSSFKREGAAWASLFNGYDEQVTFCGFIIRARLTNPYVLPEFLTYFLRSDATRKKLVAGSGQVAVTNITQEMLNILKIPLPALAEQRAIASILSDVDKKLELQRARKGKLERLKKGLMDGLLTGRKRAKMT